MEQRTIDTIRKMHDIGEEFSDEDVSVAYSGSMAEARAGIIVAVEDLKVELYKAVPSWIKRPPRLW